MPVKPKTQKTPVIIRRLGYAIDAIETANREALAGRNYLIGSFDIGSLRGAMEKLNELENKIQKLKADAKKKKAAV